MTILNCATFESALVSLSSAAHVTESTLLDALQSVDPSAVAEKEDPWVGIPQLVFAEVGVDVVRVSFDGMYLEHFSS